MLPATRNNSSWAPASFPANRMGALFDQVFGEDGGFVSQAWSGAPLAMWEDEDHLWIEAELPGVAEADVEITVHNGQLFIRGERKPEQGRRYLYNSRAFGRFQRAIALPEAVDVPAVQATLRDGVLRIDLPKSPEARPRKVQIKTS